MRGVSLLVTLLGIAPIRPLYALLNNQKIRELTRYRMTDRPNSDLRGQVCCTVALGESGHGAGSAPS